MTKGYPNPNKGVWVSITCDNGHCGAREYSEAELLAVPAQCSTCLGTGERLTRDGFEPYCDCEAGEHALGRDEFIQIMKGAME